MRRGLHTLRSSDAPGIRLFVLDVPVYLPWYAPAFDEENYESVGAESDNTDVLVVATISDGSPVVNLMAPVLVNRTHRCRPPDHPRRRVAAARPAPPSRRSLTHARIRRPPTHPSALAEDVMAWRRVARAHPRRRNTLRERGWDAKRPATSE